MIDPVSEQEWIVVFDRVLQDTRKEKDLTSALLLAMPLAETDVLLERRNAYYVGVVHALTVVTAALSGGDPELALRSAMSEGLGDIE